MADFSSEQMRKAVSAARTYLPAADAAKIERLSSDPAALRQLTAGLSSRDWANVMKVLNDPELLRRVLTSPRGQAGLREILGKLG